MSNAVILVIFAVVSYFIGNINWAILISTLRKKDIRKLGSGNPGTLNMSRNFGLKLGLLTFFLDIMKGVVPTLTAYFVLENRGYFFGTEFFVVDLAIYLCGLCAVLGHIYPVVFKFKGGKGIATTIGVFIVCNAVQGWEWALVSVMAILAALIFIYITEFGAMGSFIAITPPVVSGGIYLFLSYANGSRETLVYYVITNMIIFAICFFTWFAHRKNIERMLSGDEHATSIKQMVLKAKMKKAAAKEGANNINNAEKTETEEKDGKSADN